MLIKKVQLALYSKSAYAKLKTPCQVFPAASYSGVLSLAAYIVFHNPKLPPPDQKGELLQLVKQNPFDQKLADKHLSYNLYFQPWCDYICSCLEKGLAYIDNDQILYVIVKVNQSYLQSFNSQVTEVMQWNNQNDQDIQICLNSFFGLKLQKNQTKLNIGIANFGSAQLRSDPFRPKTNLAGLIQGIWFGNHNWNHYKILKSNFPSQSQFQNMDLLILTGSSLSINDGTIQVQQFMHLVRQAIKSNPKLRIIGFCFGHQFIAKAFGGKVVKKQKFAGIENIRFCKEFLKQSKLFESAEDQNFSLALSQYHQDYVEILPENFKNIATSDSALNQAMISQDQRIISFQYHPQYTTEYTKAYQYRVKKYEVSDVLYDFCGAGSSSKQHTESVWCMRRAIVKFIIRNVN